MNVHFYFKKFYCSNRGPCQARSSASTEQVDHETEHWPVSADLRKELDDVKYEFRAVPLRVYVGDRFVEPIEVNDTIRGALVEVHYELRHFFIATDSYDSFNATIEQILVLQPGEAPPDTPYKRKNVRDGPIRLNPTPAQQQRFQQSPPEPSGSRALVTSGNEIGAPVQHHVQHPTSFASGSRPLVILQTSTTDDDNGTKDDEECGSNNASGMYCLCVEPHLLTVDFVASTASSSTMADDPKGKQKERPC